MNFCNIKCGDELTQSLDLVAANIAKLKELFPQVLSEGKIDFKVLQEILGQELEEEQEYYRFTWAGKAQARREAHKPSTGTLRPCKEESVDWDSTQNLYIEGDNLEVLKLLQKSYLRKIKLIYIDPPYNTGKDFVYRDNYQDNLKNYLQLTGQVDGAGSKLSANTESDGRYHSNWLNMMYPRLLLARNLLKDDGVIFISIDDNEAAQLRLLCDEVFGEDNFVCQFVWAAGRKNDSKLVSASHEYMLCYRKSFEIYSTQEITWRERKQGIDDIYKIFKKLKLKYGGNFKEIELELKAWFKALPGGHPAKNHKHYSRVDSRGIYFAENISWPGGGGPKYEVLHPLTQKPVRIPSRGWIFSDVEKMRKMIADDRVFFGEDETSVPCLKAYLNDREYSVPYSVFYKDGRASTKKLRELFEKDIFENPKDVEILKSVLEFAGTKDALIFDFFAGSGTTAQAVMQLNAQDGGNRKHIQVQIPEPTDRKSEAYQAGYKTIAEIGKERIRRAGKKIREEHPSRAQELDIGFKVFKLDSSNLKSWDGQRDNLIQSLLDAQDNIKSDRTEEDILFEILLKYGLDLTLPLEEKIIAGKKVFSVGAGALFVCLADEVSAQVAEGIGQWKEVLQPPTCRVIFKDSGFSDVDKTNVLQTLKLCGVQEVKSI